MGNGTEKRGKDRTHIKTGTGKRDDKEYCIKIPGKRREREEVSGGVKREPSSRYGCLER